MLHLLVDFDVICNGFKDLMICVATCSGFEDYGCWLVAGELLVSLLPVCVPVCVCLCLCVCI